MQGLIATVDIYARAQAADDTVGGSVRSDALRYRGVRARIANERPPSVMRAQGITLPQVVEIILYPDSYGAIQAEDIVVPRDGPWVNQRLRVTGVQRSSLAVGDPRSHIQLTAVHVEYAPGVP
jgi:hypothetical protein